MCISLDRIYNVCGVPFKMIFVKGGSCILGSSEIDDVIPNYNPIHSAEIEDFYIGETLITRELASKLCVEVDGPFKRFFKEVDDTPQLPDKEDYLLPDIKMPEDMNWNAHFENITLNIKD